MKNDLNGDLAEIIEALKMLQETIQPNSQHEPPSYTPLAFVERLAEQPCQKNYYSSPEPKPCIDDGRKPFAKYAFDTACPPCAARMVLEDKAEYENELEEQGVCRTCYGYKEVREQK
jgi:hypothetical protein